MTRQFRQPWSTAPSTTRLYISIFSMSDGRSSFDHKTFSLAFALEEKCHVNIMKNRL